ncbi:hypothetical protein BBJ28_00009968 [Nothophytophthora sp. Chile5]|nr:hypothetical protein BBJ28_00009968 [Nothophytophthora sp. Chile5]
MQVSRRCVAIRLGLIGAALGAALLLAATGDRNEARHVVSRSLCSGQSDWFDGNSGDLEVATGGGARDGSVEGGYEMMEAAQQGLRRREEPPWLNRGGWKGRSQLSHGEDDSKDGGDDDDDDDDDSDGGDGSDDDDDSDDGNKDEDGDGDDSDSDSNSNSDSGSNSNSNSESESASGSKPSVSGQSSILTATSGVNIGNTIVNINIVRASTSGSEFTGSGSIHITGANSDLLGTGGRSAVTSAAIRAICGSMDCNPSSVSVSGAPALNASTASASGSSGDGTVGNDTEHARASRRNGGRRVVAGAEVGRLMVAVMLVQLYYCI